MQTTFDCLIVLNKNNSKFTGYKHNNGKKRTSYKEYERYGCRSCHKAFLRHDLHDMIERYSDKIYLKPEVEEELKKSLRNAWSEVEKDSLSKVRQLNIRLESANQQKGRLIVSLAENPELKDDIQEQITLKKQEIELIKASIEEASSIENDFNEFVDFSLKLVNDWKSGWWDLGYEDRDRCEQLLFPQLLRINKNDKVSTPEISPIYRYKPMKKAELVGSTSFNGGPGET